MGTILIYPGGLVLIIITGLNIYLNLRILSVLKSKQPYVKSKIEERILNRIEELQSDLRRTREIQNNMIDLKKSVEILLTRMPKNTSNNGFDQKSEQNPPGIIKTAADPITEVKQQATELTEPEKDNRIWVQRTKDGFSKLIASESPKNLYFLPTEEELLPLYIDKLENTNINDIIRLYEQIMVIAVGFRQVNMIKMVKAPMYFKQGDYYLFMDKGEISVE